MNKFLQTLRRPAAALACACLSAPLLADPVSTIDSTTFTAIGGDSVSGGGDWSVVAELDTCTVRFYVLDYATMTWGNGTTEGTPATTIIPESPDTTCDTPARAEFGESLSLSGGAAVLGMPAWDGQPLVIFGFVLPRPYTNAGGVKIYINDGANAWVSSNQLNDNSTAVVLIEGPVAGSGAPQNNARFGESVSINKYDTSPGFPDSYLIAVGAPQHDSGGFSNNGRVFVYDLTVTGTGQGNNSIALVGTMSGLASNEFLGTAVTTNYPYVLAGAPGASQIFVNAGAARLFDSTNVVGGVLQQVGNDYPGILSNEGQGFEVSLSDDLLLAAGGVSTAVAYTGGEPNYGGGAVAVTSGGGDVSQGGGAAAFGQLGTGAVIYRDVANDDTSAPGSDDGIEFDLSGLPSVDPGIGIDIRVVAPHWLWFADPNAGRADLVTAPCGLGKKLNAVEFALVSIPCNLPITTPLGDVFSSIGTIGDNTDIRVFAYDPTNPAGDDPVVEITAPGTTFADLGWLTSFDHPFWVVSKESEYFEVSIPATFTNTLNRLTSQPASVRRNHFLSLPRPADPVTGLPNGGGDDFARVAVANPTPRRFTWQELFYVTAGSVGDLESSPNIEPVAYVYDPSSMIGQPYRAVDSTPGFDEDSVGPYEGFWIKLNESADNGSTGGSLAVPVSDGSGG